MALHFSGKQKYFKQGFSEVAAQKLNTPILLQGTVCPWEISLQQLKQKSSKDKCTLSTGGTNNPTYDNQILLRAQLPFTSINEIARCPELPSIHDLFLAAILKNLTMSISGWWILFYSRLHKSMKKVNSFKFTQL